MIKVFKASDTNFNTNGEVILKPIEAVITKDIEEEYIEVECPLKYADFLVQDNVLVVDTLTSRKAYKIHNPIIGYTITVKAWLLWQENPPKPADRGAVIAHGKNIKGLEYQEDWDEVVTKLIPVGHKEAMLPEGHLSVTSPYQKIYEKTIEFDLTESLEEEVDLLEKEVSDNLSLVASLENSIAVLTGKVHACVSAINNLQEEKEALEQRLGQLGNTEPELKEKAIIEVQIPLVVEEIAKIEADKTDTEMALTQTQEDLATMQAVYESSKTDYEDVIIKDLRKQAQEYLNINKYPRINYDLEAHLKGVYEVGDTVRVKHPDMRVDLLTQVTSYELDVINMKFLKIEFGTLKTTLRDVLDKIEEKVEKSSETVKRYGNTVTKYKEEYKRDNEELVSRFIAEIYGVENGIYGMLQQNQSTFRQTASEISGTVSRVNADLSQDVASLIIKADNIESTVSSNFSTLNNRVEENKSQITQTATSIRSEVSNTLRSYSTTTQMNSSITQTASSIRSEVSNTLRSYSTTTQMNSSITQTATSIRSEVSTAINGVNQNVSRVEQTANKISWIVKSGTSSSNFTLTDRAISLVANTINLSGYVTFSNLSTSGQTVIDGGNIKANTIIADDIKAGGTITGSKFTNGNVTIDNSDITIDGRNGFLKGKYGSSTYNLIGFDSRADRMVIGNSSNYSASTITLLGRTIDFGQTTSGAGYTTVRINGLIVATRADVNRLASLQDGYISGRYVELYNGSFRPASTSTNSPVSLGNSSYRFSGLYSRGIDIAGNVKLGSSTSQTLAFFGGNGARKTSVETVSTQGTLTQVRDRLNSLIVALRSYNIV